MSAPWEDYLAAKTAALAPAGAPPAPVAAAATPAPWEQYLAAKTGRKAPAPWETYLATKAKPVTAPIRGAAFDLGQAARNTAGAVGDVFGTLQRGTVGALYGAEHGGVIPAVNEGVYGAFHPHDTGIVDRNDLNFRQTTHLEDFKDHSAAPNLLGRGRNAVVDFTGQTISDPSMLVGGPIIKGALKGLEMGAKAIPGVEAGARAIAEHPQFRETQNFIRALGPEKSSLTPKGVAVSAQADTRIENKYHALQQAVEAVHARNADGMNAHWQDPDNVAYPEEAARAMHGIGYLGGDADARAKATAAGFDPLTGEHLDTPLLNLHTWREGYVPKQRITVKDLEDENPLDPNIGPAAGKVAVRRPRGIGYAKEQVKGDETTPLADRWLARATTGLLDAKKAEKQQRFIDDFGLDHGRHTGRAVELGDEIMRATDPAHKAKLTAEREAELKTAAGKQARLKSLVRDPANMTAVRLGDAIKTVLTSKGEAFRQAGKDTGVAGQQFAPANAQSGDFTIGQSAKKGDLRRIMAEQKRAEAAARTAATTAKGAANVAAQTQAGSARLADRLTRDLSGHAVKVDELLRAIQSPDELRKAAGVQVGEMSQRATDLTAAQGELKHHAAIEKAYGFADKSAQEAAMELVNRRIAAPGYEVKLHPKAVEDSTDSPYRETGYNKQIPSGHGGSPFTVGDIDDLRKELKAFDGVNISHVELLAKLHDMYTARQAHLDDARRIIDATRGKYGASRTGFKEPSYAGAAVDAGDLTTGAARLTRLERGKAVADRRAARKAMGKMPSIPQGIQRQAQRLSDKTPAAMASAIGRADRAVARGRTDAAKVAGRAAKLKVSATERAAYAAQHTELNARRNAAIAKLTARQTEILDRDNAIVVPKFLTADGALFGADARKGKFPARCCAA